MPSFSGDRTAGLRLLPALCFLLAISLLSLAQASAQTIATYDFENGSTNGWHSFYGSIPPVSTTAAAYSGNSSLLASGGGANDPAINVSSLLQPGATYTITGWIRLTSGEGSSTAHFTVNRTDTDGAHYDWVGPQTANDSGWTQIGGTYKPTTTETGLTLYVESGGSGSFYLDDVVITQTAPAPGGTLVKEWTFANGQDGWFPFGSPTLSVTAPPVQDPHGDTNALLTTNRSQSFEGPAVQLVGLNGLVAGATYQVSAYVLLATADSSSPTVSMTTQLKDCATGGTYTGLGTTTGLTNGVWTKVQGNFSISNQPGPPTSLVLYFQSSSATDSFYIGDVRIGEIAPPPPDPSQQDNSGISSNFEDGGLDGWSGRGPATVANVSGIGHNSNNSLFVSNRQANWQGAVISVNNKMYPGSVYNVSGWVMLAPQDGTNHVINVSLQTQLSGVTGFPTVTPYPGVTVPADGQWHQINVMGYNMSSAYDQGQAFLYFQTFPSSGNDLVSFYLDDFQLSYVQPPTIQTDIPSISQAVSPFFPIGAAIDPTDLSGAHEQLLARHFNSITSGNDMKWSSVESSYGSFNFATADKEVGVAVCNNMLIRGHNLVWATGAQTPSYATGDGTNSTANQATVTNNIQEHIKGEVQHFGNKVTVWDVVNEPLDPRQPDCLVHGPFYKVLGEKYIEVALEAAHQYAPSAKLFINDYSTADGNRLGCMVTLLKQLQTDLSPETFASIGVGHEFHNAINYPSVQGMVNAVDTIANNFPGIDQEVTEYDESVYHTGDLSNYGNNVPLSVLAAQGWLYADTFDAYKQLATQGELSRVTIWGMADDDTWLDGFPVSRKDYPLPFDTGLQAKWAYWGIVDKTQLPGYGLNFTSTVTAGTSDTRTITLTATNPSSGTAFNTQIAGLTFTQQSKPSCTPQIVSGGNFPVALGDIPAGGTATASFTVSIVGCNPNAQWLITAPWNANTYELGTFNLTTDFNRGNGGNSGH